MRISISPGGTEPQHYIVLEFDWAIQGGGGVGDDIQRPPPPPAFTMANAHYGDRGWKIVLNFICRSSVASVVPRSLPPCPAGKDIYGECMHVGRTSSSSSECSFETLHWGRRPTFQLHYTNMHVCFLICVFTTLSNLLLSCGNLCSPDTIKPICWTNEDEDEQRTRLSIHPVQRCCRLRCRRCLLRRDVTHSGYLIWFPGHLPITVHVISPSENWIWWSGRSQWASSAQQDSPGQCSYFTKDPQRLGH